MIDITRYAIKDLPTNLRAILDANGSLLTSFATKGLFGTLGGSTVCWVAADGSDEVVLLPAIEFGVRPILRMQAMPDGLYANPISNSNDNVFVSKAVVGLLDKIRRYYSKSHIHDYAASFADSEVLSSLAMTMVADISPIDWLPPDSELRRNIRQHTEGGKRVRAITVGDLDAFYSLAKKSLASRDQTVRYSRTFFERLAELSQKDERIIWLVQEGEGTLSCSQIFFLQDSELLYWQAYLDRTDATDRPAQGMMMQAVNIAKVMGATFLNLGSSPPDATDLISYKQRWGWGCKVIRRVCKQARIGEVVVGAT